MRINYKSIIIAVFILLTAAATYTILFPQNTEEKYSEKARIGRERKTTSGALESMQFMSQVRSFPDAEIPQDKFFKAFEYTKTEMSEFSPSTSPTEWTSIGPFNVGGRSLAFAFHPNDTATVYMGSASGGLWKSTTGGLGANAWTRVETGYPSLAVSWITIDSANPNIMYIGTGENYGYQYSINNGVNIRVTRGMYGIGILKTTNGGVTWTKSLDWSYSNQRGVWRVIMNPKNHNVLYAATSEGVYKTNNAGGSWSQVLNYQMVMDLEINTVDTSMIFVSVGNLSNNIPNANVGIYRSTNAGASWTKLTSGLPATWSGKAMLDIFDGNQNTIFASIANDPSVPSNSYLGMYKSTDAGLTWTLTYNNNGLMTNQGWYNNAFLVKTNDQNTILIGNLDVYKSTNGGSSFSQKSSWSAWNTGATPPGQPESGSSNFSHADQHEFFSNPLDPNKLYCITDGGLYRSNDFGEIYYSCNGGYVTTQFYGGFANSYQDSIWCLGGLQDNRAVFYQGNPGWYKTHQGDGFWCAVNSTSHQTSYTEYSYGAIYRSTNGGVTFNGISVPGSGSEANYCFAAPFICCKSNPSIMYIGGINVYKSTAGGSGWTNVGTLSSKALSIVSSFTSTDTVYVGTIPVTSGPAATIYRSTNGSSFTDVAAGQLPNRFITDLTVNPNNSAEVYAVLGGFGSGHVYKSSNAGLNWTNISGNLPDVPHQCVVVDPLYPQNVYVGNDLAVYVTTNSGAQWFEYRNGMPYALVYDLTIVFPNRHIRATTHGNGVYERSLVQNPVGISQIGSEIPKTYSLSQNYPNPFNPTTKIRFEIPLSRGVDAEGGRGVFTQIAVYDISGRLVETIVDRNIAPGKYEVEWSAAKYSSGVYFYKLAAGDFAETKKMILLK